jgi:hypothetical protein
LEGSPKISGRGAKRCDKDREIVQEAGEAGSEVEILRTTTKAGYLFFGKNIKISVGLIFIIKNFKNKKQK